MSRYTCPTAIAAALLLSACSTGDVFELIPEEVTSRDMAPPGAPPGTCWGRDATPAVIETVTEQVIHETADDAPVYETQTSQQIITPREDTWFERPCDDVMTPEFNASLQRALEARGHYRGPITGRMDGRTRAAERLAAIERAEISEREAAEQAARQAEEDKRAAETARIAEAEAAEARRIAQEQAAIAERRAAEQAAAEASEREKNKRAKELALALEDEKKRTGGTVFDPLPISSESY